MEEQCVSREKNLVLMGLQGAQGGGNDRDSVKVLFKNTLGISNIDIDDLYHLGQPGGSRPIPLLIKLRKS